MQVSYPQQTINFQNAGIAAAVLLEENVMLNKAILDASVDIPFVCFANNKTERKERLRRVSVNYSLSFFTPFITLPLTNRLAMKYISRLTTKFMSKESYLIHISNKYLKNKDLLKEGMELLQNEKQTIYFNKFLNKLNKLIHKLFKNKSNQNLKLLPEEMKIDYSGVVEKYGGDYEVIRKKLINAKNAVLSFDFLFSSGSIVGMALLNNFLTKKNTNMDGYSAEFELADKKTVEKRAEKFKREEPIRRGITAAMLAAVTALPFAIKKGLDSKNETGLAGFIKKHAAKFDYTKGIFMKRLPLFLFVTAAQGGLCLASRNETELKNNLLNSSTGIAVFFCGDILINSLLSKLSDKFLNTKIIDKNAPKTFMNKIISPTVPIKNLNGKSKVIASINFFINLATLSLLYGFGVPALINRNVRKDLKKEITQINWRVTDNTSRFAELRFS